jgi:hypothetical protein
MADQELEDLIEQMKDGPAKAKMQEKLDALRQTHDEQLVEAAKKVRAAEAATTSKGGPSSGTSNVDPDMVNVLAAAFKAAMGTSGSRAGGNRTTISIKTPEQYKPSMDIDAWWLRVNNYANTAGIDEEKDRILQFTSGLSPEAYSIMHRAGYHLEDTESLDELERSLKLIFGDQKTEAQWADEFNQAKQEATETAGYFVDRVKWMAMKAFPGIWQLEVPQAQVQLVRPQVVKGLRSAHVRLWLIHSPPDTLEELRLRAVQYEKDEAAATGKPAVAKPASHFNAGKAGASNKSPSDRDQSDSKKPGLRGRNSDRKSNKGSSSNDKIGAVTKCSFCKKLGHETDRCFKLKNSQDKAALGDCKRCGRPGHEAASCFQDKHKSGTVLKPNGVVKPDWFKAKYLAGDADSKKDEPSAGVHLNDAGDVSLQMRPRTMTTQW